ncbi:A24 family peptidase [Bradyrhizobium lablabi]|uniref:prepilin peptidase n=1 Tax=Bradyrhizobium lablabi TaxID=722472 RepID=UPI001BACD161|nr:A24 family peptidase [Bradyrhizobium lablabi]MBR0697769.1 prepilin peptidase [Bradyrhizobium lablabi]
MRATGREYALVGWGLVAGAVWIAVSLSMDDRWATTTAAASLYLVGLLAAICAIDARYGIIPDSMVLALAAGGVIQLALIEPIEAFWQRAAEASFVLVVVYLLRSGYRWLRGHDGLGLGDVKFLGASVFWIGIAGVPGLLLVAVLSAFASLLILRLQGHQLHGRQAISFGPHLAIGLWWMWTIGVLQ